MDPEPIWDIAHLAHVELFTPAPAGSLHLFTEIMGMSLTARRGKHARRISGHGTIIFFEAHHRPVPWVVKAL